MNRTAEYEAWCGMKARCHNPAHKAFKNYGGRGVFVCDEWKDDFKRFFFDVGPRPSSSHTLDRIDNNKGYSPENCRWATRVEQAKNRRSVINITFNGKTQCIADWGRELGLWPARIQSRYHKGWPISEVLRATGRLSRAIKK